MKVKDVMSDNVVSISPDGTLSKALSLMDSNQVHQLVVLDSGKLSGMLQLKDIVTKSLPFHKTRVRGFETPTSTVDKDADVMDGAKILFRSGLRAIPVTESEKVVGVLAETDVVSAISVDAKPRDIMYECVFVSPDDSIDKVDSLMSEHNVSRIPVVKNGEIKGVVRTLDLIKTAVEETMESRGRSYTPKEKLKRGEIGVTSFMSEPFVVDADVKIDEIKDDLAEKEEALVKSGDGIYIFTPKDVLEHFVASMEKGVLVQLVNLDKESSRTVAKIHQTAEDVVKKVGNMVRVPEFLTIYLERHHTQGKKTKYSISTRFSTADGLFVSKAWGWEPITVAQESLNKLEREVIKKHKKFIESRRGPKS